MTTTANLSSRDQLVRELTRTKKADLISMALAVGRSRGNHWLLGGPRDWSKDELINYLILREGDVQQHRRS